MQDIKIVFNNYFTQQQLKYSLMMGHYDLKRV